MLASMLQGMNVTPQVGQKHKNGNAVAAATYATDVCRLADLLVVLVLLLLMINQSNLK